MTKIELENTIKELKDQIDELKQQRRNAKGPSVAIFPSRKRMAQVRELDQDERDELVSAMAEAQDALDEGRLDHAQEILDRILDQYDEDEDEAGTEEEPD